MTTSTNISSDISTNLLPTVCNIEEARDICKSFASVLTVGPELDEVHDFAHPDHKVVSFDDIAFQAPGYRAPNIHLVREAVQWGAGRTNLLVHCHAGMSRSTSTAWGIAIANGFDPQVAYDLLKQNHPVERQRKWQFDMSKSSYLAQRAFIPNVLVLKFLEQILELQPGLLRDIATSRASN